MHPAAQFAAALVLGAIFAATTADAQSSFVYCPRPPFNAVLNASAFTPCASGRWNYSEFQCRTTFFPASYDPADPDPKVKGAFQTSLERRAVYGTPRTIIFLISGGPGGASGLHALATSKIVKRAFITDYVVVIPALRGTQDTDYVQQWAGFPGNLSTTVNAERRAYQSFNPTNTAIDIITTAKAYKSEFPAAKLVAAGFSFGTFQLQRVMQLEPALFEAVLLDGAAAAVNDTNQFAQQSLALTDLTKLVGDNCARSSFCSARSLPTDDIVRFVDSVRNGTQASPCLTALVSQVAPGAPPSQVLASIVYSLVLFNSAKIPVQLTVANTSDPEVVNQFIDALLTTAAMEAPADWIPINSRSIPWSLLNQLAQCTSAAQLGNFATAARPFALVLGQIGGIGGGLIAPTSPIGNIYTTALFGLLSEGRNPRVPVDTVRAANRASAFAIPESAFQGETLLLNEIASMNPAAWAPSCYSDRAPTNVSANVHFLCGELDAGTPFASNRRAYNDLSVAPGFRKTISVHANKEHMVLGFGQSQCVIPFLRGFFLGNATAAAEYDTCLAAENAASIDWELAALATVAGSSPWQGMPAAPISTRSATTASATVSPTPTSRPSSADAPSEEAWMALAAIAAGAVAML